MLKMVRELGPLAIGVAVVGIVIGLLLERGNNIGNWVLAAFLIGHGMVHVMYVVPLKAPQPATTGGPEWAFGLDRSWVLSGMGTPAAVLHGLGRVLVAITVIGFTLAGLASIPLLVPAAVWPALVLVSAVASLVLLGLFFHRNLFIGLGINIVLLWVVMASAWAP